MTTELRHQAEQFAYEIMETLAGVFPQGDLGLDLTVDSSGVFFSLSCNDPKGIELQVGGKTVMRFEIDFLLTADRSGEWLKVKESTFALAPEGSGTPFFRYDFLAEAHRAPSAHINVHAHRDDFIAALIGSGKGGFARIRRKKFLDAGALPRVSNFHFPVGGTRFRPCLEDVLESVITEFGLDHKQGFADVLEAGKRRYRERQLRATIRDHAEVAASELRSLGYVVECP